jgi:hypothetical protein
LFNGGQTQMTAGADIAVDATTASIELLRLTRDQAPDLILARSGGIDALRSAPVVETTSGAVGHQTVGQSGSAVPIIVTNRGAGVLTITSALLSGTDSADFTTVGDTCSGNSFDTGQSCIVSVAYAPAAAGASSATLALATNAVTATVNVALSGTGVAPNSGPQGPAGADGAQGPAGATGATGAQGATGATGAQGLTGATGPRGPQGAEGPPGAAGRDAVVTCKVRKTSRTRVRVTCSVRLAARTSVSLRRAGRTVARGVVSAAGRVVLGGRRVPRGTYMLVAGDLRLKVKVG